MKKSILLIAAAAVLCAVVCAAGCVSSDDDGTEILGTWYCSEEDYTAFISLADDNTGVYCCVANESDRDVPGELPFVDFFLWDLDGDKLSLAFEKEVLTGTVDEKAGTITSSSGSVYQFIDTENLLDKESKFIGTWYADEGDYACVLLVLEDNVGIYSCLKDDNKRAGNYDSLPSFEPFVWDVEDDVLSTAFEDGSLVTAVIDEKTGHLVNEHKITYDRISGANYPAGPSFLGTWYHSDDSLEAVAYIMKDNTGVIFCLKDDGKKTGVEAPYMLSFIWDVTDDNEISLLFEDGVAESAVLVPGKKELTIHLSGDNRDITYTRITGSINSIYSLLEQAAAEAA